MGGNLNVIADSKERRKEFVEKNYIGEIVNCLRLDWDKSWRFRNLSQLLCFLWSRYLNRLNEPLLSVEPSPFFFLVRA